MPGPHTLRLLPLNLPFVGRGLDPSAAPCPYLTPYLFHLPVGAGMPGPHASVSCCTNSGNPCSRQPPRSHQLPPARNLPRPKNSPRGCFCPAVRWTRGCDLRLPHQAAPLGRGLPSATAAPAPASCFRRRRRSPPQQAFRFPHGSPFTPDTY